MAVGVNDWSAKQALDRSVKGVNRKFADDTLKQNLNRNAGAEAND